MRFLILALFFFSCYDSSSTIKEKNISDVLYQKARESLKSNLYAPSSLVVKDSSIMWLRNGDGSISNSVRINLFYEASNLAGANLAASKTFVYKYNGTDSLAIESYTLTDAF